VAARCPVIHKLNFNFIRDIAPVASTDRAPLIMEVNQTFPARSVPEFIAFAKANPGKINMASAGIGTGQHLAGEMFKMMAGVDMTHVPYRSAGPALTDLISGQLSRRRRCGWCKAAALPLPACGERACPGLDPGSAREARRVRGRWT
jgi:Tripartite tricarboxylate transporter family receptor